MNCVLCENKKNVFWENSSFYIVDVNDEIFPGFIRVISKRHVAEMSELSDNERTMLWSILHIVEKTMLAELRPDKINYAQFGNMVPHLHWHIMARWTDDSHFPECPWGPEQRKPSRQQIKERRCLMEKFKLSLIEILNREFLQEAPL